MTAARTQPIIAGAAVLSLAFWFVEIERAFGLPAHPLLVHVPLVFIPVLGLAALAVAATGRWVLPVAAFSVVTLAATLLAVLRRPGRPPRVGGGVEGGRTSLTSQTNP